MNKDGQTTLVKWVAVITLVVIVTGITVGVFSGCEEQNLTTMNMPQPTSRPATQLAIQPTSPVNDITSPIYIVTIQKERLDAVLASYLVESENVAKARVALTREQCLTDVLYQQAQRKGTQKCIAELKDRREKLEKEDTELTARSFELLGELTAARMDMARFERENPGWWLMVIK